MEQTLFTIGHSNHSLEHFTALLKMHEITALCDVRSKPYSRVNPQFNREGLKQTLQEASIAYVFLGKELGARSDDPSCHDQGRVKFDLLSRNDLFRCGLQRVREGMSEYRLALMCAEKEPLECHRTILIARHLAVLGLTIEHIHADGRLEGHSDAVKRLIRELALPEQDMFRSPSDIVEDAYGIQEARIAYRLASPSDGDITRSAAP